MTERDAPSTEDNAHPIGDGVRPYRPGSRLRRALDLARESHRPRPDEALRATGARPPTRPTTVDDPPPASTTPTPQDPAVRLAAEDPGSSTARSRRRGLGRGLDALLPQGEPSAEVPRETWEASTQGWVHGEEGLEWRTIVTTAERLEHWSIGTYLGVVSGRARTPIGDEPAATESSVRAALERMTEVARLRGAHGVIGVTLTLGHEPEGMVATAVGSAVTLENRSPTT